MRHPNKPEIQHPTAALTSSGFSYNIFLVWIFKFVFPLSCLWILGPSHQVQVISSSSNTAMEFLFGKRKTPEQLMRENQRTLNKAMRDLDRERAKMEQQEKKIIVDIKKMANAGQMDAVKVLAKDLVRTRRYVKKFMMMRANIQAVSLKITGLKSTNAMAQAMKGVAKAMGQMNKQMNLPQIQKIMQEFEKQSEIMDMKEEMMNDVMDDAMGDDNDEEETDQIVNKVLDELGLQIADQVGNLPIGQGTVAPGGGVAKKTPTAQPAGGSDLDADLEARLENLRRE
ncbi:Charged multivesicular body protein 2a [Hypsibius exemplaris]|uniref:Charged multivesicular body protein 2a n=1 Tax=Hypsibius exemplaris TaxID=2072580 RepID=A0A1W0XCW8_HYPEX|nr:Charged multivesicular body protein 2a [Hypsibius exemplaris]